MEILGQDGSLFKMIFSSKRDFEKNCLMSSEVNFFITHPLMRENVIDRLMIYDEEKGTKLLDIQTFQSDILSAALIAIIIPRRVYIYQHSGHL